MANLGFKFKTSDAPVSEFDPLPAGDYVCMVTESEMKPTKNGTGQYIELKIEVVEGERANRVLFERLNVQNSNPKAEEIAYSTLAKICEAIGKEEIEDTQELHDKRFIAVVSVEDGKPYIDAQTGETKQGNPQNRIKTYKPMSVTSSQPPAQAQPAEASSVPPWKR